MGSNLFDGNGIYIKKADNCNITKNGINTGWSSPFGQEIVNNISSDEIYNLSCYAIANSQTLNSNSSVRINILKITLLSSPSQGQFPLTVSLNATLAGTSFGTARYFFDCNNDGINELDIGNIWSYNYTTNVCKYNIPGTYVAKVEAWHNS